MAEWFWLEGRGEVDQWAPQFTRDIEVDGVWVSWIFTTCTRKARLQILFPLLFVHGCEVLLPITMIRKCWISATSNFKGQAAFWKCAKSFLCSRLPLQIIPASTWWQWAYRDMLLAKAKEKRVWNRSICRGYCSSTKILCLVLNYYYFGRNQVGTNWCWHLDTTNMVRCLIWGYTTWLTARIVTQGGDWGISSVYYIPLSNPLPRQVLRWHIR